MAGKRERLPLSSEAFFPGKKASGDFSAFLERAKEAAATGHSVGVYREFGKQDEAFRFADSLPAERRPAMRFFVREDETRRGARRYIVADEQAFLRSYLRLPPGARHHYELMRDGAPCRLYFDLEFKRALNPRIVEADERAMLALFIKLLGAALAKTFDVELREEDVLVLDSSTSDKFSCHVHTHLRARESMQDGGAEVVREAALFADTMQAGHFVRALCDDMLRTIKTQMVERAAAAASGQQDCGSSDALDSLLVVLRHPAASQPPAMQTHAAAFANEDDEPKDSADHDTSGAAEDPQLLVAAATQDERGLFIDSGVYSRNRCFRMPFSCKYGKSAFLIPSLHFPFQVIGPNGALEPLDVNDAEQTIHASLIVPSPPPDNVRLLSFAPAVPSPWSFVSFSSLSLYGSPDAAAAAGNAALQRGLTGAVSTGLYPGVSEFLERSGLLARGGSVGRIKSCVGVPVSEGKGKLVYQVSGNRFCENIGRAHSSNGVYFIADLDLGIVFQKCFDPECRHFRGAPVALPPLALESRDEARDFEALLAAGNAIP